VYERSVSRETLSQHPTTRQFLRRRDLALFIHLLSTFQSRARGAIEFLQCAISEFGLPRLFVGLGPLVEGRALFVLGQRSFQVRHRFAGTAGPEVRPAQRRRRRRQAGFKSHRLFEIRNRALAGATPGQRVAQFDFNSADCGSLDKAPQQRFRFARIVVEPESMGQAALQPRIAGPELQSLIPFVDGTVIVASIDQSLSHQLVDLRGAR